MIYIDSVSIKNVAASLLFPYIKVEYAVFCYYLQNVLFRYLLLLRGTQKKVTSYQISSSLESYFLLLTLIFSFLDSTQMELRKAKLEGEQQFLFDQATTEKLRSGALMFKLIWPIFADRVRVSYYLHSLKVQTFQLLHRVCVLFSS